MLCCWVKSLAVIFFQEGPFSISYSWICWRLCSAVRWGPYPSSLVGLGHRLYSMFVWGHWLGSCLGEVPGYIQQSGRAPERALVLGGVVDYAPCLGGAIG